MNTEEQPNTAPSIAAAIVAITGDLARDGIAKNGKNQQQGYSFRGIEQVYSSLAPLLVKHHVAIIPIVEERIETVRATQRGGSLYSVAMRVRFLLTCSVDGSSIEATVWGEGMDSADKATNKAMSAAYKYMAFLTFCIPVDGMPDADSGTPMDRKPAQKLEPFDAVEFAIEAIKQASTPASLRAVGERIKATRFMGVDKDNAVASYRERQQELGITNNG